LEETYENKMQKIREVMNQQFNHVIYAIKNNPTLANVKPGVLMNKKNVSQSTNILFFPIQ
jgi:hypothetical protein